MDVNRRALHVVLICAVACLPGAMVRAEITTDGTMGAAQNLAGPDFIIPNTLGTQRGANLFHSFSQFNIAFNETAAFTSNFAGVTDNIFARVTGPNASTIDGALFSDVPGADLWLINPRGVMFGQGAFVDVLGSFFVSTADNIHFSDDTQFGADLTNAANSVLSVADPVSFGFLPGNEGLLSLDSAQILVSEEESVALVGRLWREDFDGNPLPGIQDSRIDADGGAVELFSVGPVADGFDEGTVSFDQNDGPLFDEGFESLGLLTIENSTIFNEESDPAVQARVFIQGGELLISGSELNAQNLGDERGTFVGIRGTAGVRIEDNTRIASDSLAGGGAGIVVVFAEDAAIEVSGASQLGSRSTGTANTEAGFVRLTAGESITITEGSTVSADSELNDPDVIEGVRAAGEIILETSDLTLDQGARVSVDAEDGNPDIGGAISVFADTVTLTNRAEISASTGGNAQGGNIFIEASDSLLVSNRATISASGLANSTGEAGFITITGGGDVVLLDGGRVEANSFGAGRGGDIALGTNEQALNSLLIEGVAPAEAASTDPSLLSYDRDRPPDFAFSSIFGDFATLGTDAEQLSFSRALLGDIQGDVAFVAAFDNVIDGQVISPDLVARTSFELDDDSSPFGNGFAPVVRGFAAGSDDLIIDVSQFPDFEFDGDPNVPGGDYAVGIQFAQELPALPSGVGTVARAEGDGGSIFVNALTLDLRDFAEITLDNSGLGVGGDANLGAVNFNVEDGARISAETIGFGPAGSVLIAADFLTLSNGGRVDASSRPASNLPSFDQEFFGYNDAEAPDFVFATNQLNEVNDVGPLQPGAVSSLTISSDTVNAPPFSFAFVAAFDNTVGDDTPDLVARSGDSFGDDFSPFGDGLAPTVTGVVERDTSVVLEVSGFPDEEFEGNHEQSGDYGINFQFVPLPGNAGDIFVAGYTETFAESVLILGNEDRSAPFTGLFSESRRNENTPAGASGSIVILSDELELFDRARVSTSSNSPFDGGDIAIEVGNLFVDGAGAGILAFTLDAGDGGNIEVLAESDIVLMGGATVSASTGRTGQAGNIDLLADNIMLDNAFVTSNAASDARGGNAGTVDVIASSSLRIANDSLVATRSEFVNEDQDDAEGNASGEVELGGTTVEISGGSNVSVSTIDGQDGDLPGLVVVGAGELRIFDGGQISATTDGSALGGDIDIISDVLEISGRSGITGTTRGTGEGGIILINSREVRLLDGGRIDANTTGPGLGGLIFLGDEEAPVETLLISGTAPALQLDDIGFDQSQQTLELFSDDAANNLEPLEAGAAQTVVITRDEIGGVDGDLFFFAAFDNTVDSDGLQPDLIARTAVDDSDDSSLFGNGFAPALRGFAAAGDDLQIDVSGFPDFDFFGDHEEAGNYSINLQVYSDLEERRGGIYSLTDGGIGDGGNIEIIATDIQVLTGGEITADTRGTGLGGFIDITAPTITLDGGSITANALATGDGGFIDLRVDTLNLLNNGEIRADATPDEALLSDAVQNVASLLANTEYDTTLAPDAIFSSLDGDFAALAPGASSRLDLNVGDALTEGSAFIFIAAFDNSVSGTQTPDLIAASLFETDDDSSVFGSGLAPRVRGIVDADLVSLMVSGFPDFQFEGNHSEQGDYAVNIQFVQLASLPGDAGDVVIRGLDGTVARQVTIDNASVTSRSSNIGAAGSVGIRAANIDVTNAGVVSTETTGGVGGNVTLNVDALTLDDAEITASTSGAGTAGSVLIEGTASPGNTLVASGSRISSTSAEGASANAGSVSIDMQRVDLANNSEVTVAASGSGAAGSIEIDAEQLTLSSGTTVNVRSEEAQGGNITFEVGDIFRADSATVQASSNGQVKDDAGGNVTIRAARFVTLNNAQVRADAVAGSGGVIRVITDTFIRSADSVLTADSQQNQAGEITIDSVNDVSGTIVEIDEPDTELPKPVARRCTPAQVESRSSLAVRLVGEDAVESDYLATTDQTQSTPPGAASCGGGSGD